MTEKIVGESPTALATVDVHVCCLSAAVGGQLFGGISTTEAGNCS
jgi:hypothetical protein